MKPKLTDFSLTTSNQHGHRQAMSKTFLRLKTRPDEYTPQLTKCYFDEVTHCELCGAALTYSFNLVHAHDVEFTRKLSLRVGADCIYNFCEAYMPGSAEQILYTIQEAMSDSKVNKFKKDNPNIFTLNDEIKKTLSALRASHGYSVQKLQAVIRFAELTRELTRQEYLSKPKVLYIESLGKLLKSKEFQATLLAHKSHQPQALTEYLKTAPKEEKKFYEKFQVLSPVAGFGTVNQTISTLDKQIFNEQLSIKMSKVSPQWVNQAQTPEGIFLLSQPRNNNYGEVPYLIGIFQRFTPLRHDQVDNIKKHMDNSKIKKPLTKLPKVWHNVVKELISKNEV
jgi:hypothetical protein